jgi:hypothetical protein
MTDRLYRFLPLIPRMARPARILALALAAGLAAMLGPIACGLMTAGGGSGIENPALALTFKEQNGEPANISGNLRLYREASDWKDTGFYFRALDNQDTALISSRDLQSLPPGALPMDSLSPDSSMGFNIVVSANGMEAMLRGFRLRGNRSRGYTFERGPSGRDSGLNAEILLAQSVLLFPGSMPASERDKDIRVIFVPGSPYFAMVGANGSILFPLLPPGSFPVKAAAYTLLDTSIVFYCTPDSLDTGRPFAPGRWLPCGP